MTLVLQYDVFLSREGYYDTDGADGLIAGQETKHSLHGWTGQTPESCKISNESSKVFIEVNSFSRQPFLVLSRRHKLMVVVKRCSSTRKS